MSALKKKQEESERRTESASFVGFFFYFFGRPGGPVKGGASWETRSLSGRAKATRSACIFINRRHLQKRKIQPIFNPLAIPNYVSLRWHMELASAPAAHHPPTPPGTCSSLMSATPTPLLSLSSATPPLIGTTATSPRRRRQPRCAAAGNASGVLTFAFPPLNNNETGRGSGRAVALSNM